MKGRSKRAEGGGVQKGVKANDAAPTEVYAGAGSNVVKEAKERKHGGKVDGAKAKMRSDRSARKSGGRVGSNMNPLSSAASGTPAQGHKTNC
jgi:hypothetical protein